MNKTIIGAGPISRIGKNLFCDIALQILKEEYNKTSKIYSLAYYLKKDLQKFVKEKLNLDIFSDKTEEKKIFRDLLVWYADIKRKETNGRYYLNLLAKDLEQDTNDVILISDIRYENELEWLQNELNGYLVCIRRYITNKEGFSELVLPANEHETYNSPILYNKCNYILTWDTVSDPNVLDNKNLKDKVRKCLKHIFNEQ